MLQFWRMLCRRGLFSSGCFAAVVVLPPLADALPPRLCLVTFAVPLADALPLRLSLVASAVSPLYWLPLCCVHVSGLVGRGFEVEGPPRVFLAFVFVWDYVGNPRITCVSYVPQL
jgi:hypothetical protein